LPPPVTPAAAADTEKSAVEFGGARFADVDDADS
jgi:hypothetical protein